MGTMAAAGAAVTATAEASVTATAAVTAKLQAPAEIHAGARVSVHASGLISGRYRLFIGVAVSHPRGGRPVECSAPVGFARQASGSATFSGLLPGRLTCRTGSGPPLGAVKLATGRYSLVLGVPLGPGAFDAQRSFVMRTVRVV